MSLAVIIPARSGSKRIPGKNFRSFMGRPIIARVCDEVLKSRIAETVYVSSDATSTELASLPETVKTLERSAALSDDYATIRDVMCDAIAKIEGAGSHYHGYVLVYATAVLVNASSFQKAATEFDPLESRFLLSVTDYGHPIQRAFSLTEDAALRPAQNFEARQRTQDFQHFYHDAAAFCFGPRDLWMSDTPILGTQTIGFPLSRTECWDIDTPEDWMISEAIFTARSMKCDQR